jgi:hypothetical protein
MRCLDQLVRGQRPGRADQGRRCLIRGAARPGARAGLARGRVLHPGAASEVRAWYAFPSAHAVYSAAILLNAQNPARTAPNLPGLTPSTHPGDYEEASSAGGQITAKRVANAWLLVQGPDQRQRTPLLNNINVAGTAIHH